MATDRERPVHAPTVRGDLADLARRRATPAMEKPGPELPKRRALAEIRPLGRLERLDLVIADILLANAIVRRDDPEAGFAVPLAEVTTYARANVASDVEAALARLSSVPVLSNAEGRDRTSLFREPAPLLTASVRMTGRRREIVWAYPEAIREALLRPRTYAWIELDVLSRTRSRFGALLYPWLAVRAGFGPEARWATQREWTVKRTDLSAILGFDAAMPWPHVEQRVLAPAMKDIALSRRFRATVEPIHGAGRGRGGAPVVEVLFRTDPTPVVATLRTPRVAPADFGALAKAARDAPPYAVTPQALLGVARTLGQKYGRPDFDAASALTLWQVLIHEALTGAAPHGHPRRGDALLASILRRGADQALADALDGDARDGWSAWEALVTAERMTTAREAAAARWIAAHRSAASRPAPALPPGRRSPARPATRTAEIRFRWAALLMAPAVASAVRHAVIGYEEHDDVRRLRQDVCGPLGEIVGVVEREVLETLRGCRDDRHPDAFHVVLRREAYGLIESEGLVYVAGQDAAPERLPGRYRLDVEVRSRLEELGPVVVLDGGSTDGASGIQMEPTCRRPLDPAIADAEIVRRSRWPDVIGPPAPEGSEPR